MPTQHENVSPMTPAQRAAFAAGCRRLATLEAQAGTEDPAKAVESLLWLAAKYEEPPSAEWLKYDSLAKSGDIS